MSKSPLKICAILGSARNGRMADRLWKFLKPKLEQKGYIVDCIDPLTCGLPMLENPIQMISDPAAVPAALAKCDQQIQDADAYLLLSAEYNRCIPPALCNIIDYCRPKSYALKTCAIVSYSMGPGAGFTMVPQLRAKMVEMGAPPVPYVFGVGGIHSALNAEGVPSQDKQSKMDSQFEAMCTQLEYYTNSLNQSKLAGHAPKDATLSTAKAAQPLHICVLLGSARDGRMADRVWAYMKPKIQARGHTVTVVDPLSCDLPLLVNPVQFYPDSSKVPAPVHKYNESVKAADVYLVLSPEYNRTIPPCVTNIIDHAPPRSYAFKQSAIVCYSMGPGGGFTMVPQLRALMVEMGAPPVSSVFSIGSVHSALNAEGVPADGEADKLDKKFQALFAQLEFYGGALKTSKTAGLEPEWKGNMVSVL